MLQLDSSSPACFWRLLAPLGAVEWDSAVSVAAEVLPPQCQGLTTACILDRTLGEGQFGPDHWRLGFAARAYYTLKPLLPRDMTRLFRRMHRISAQASFPLGWPIEDRYARFQWGAMRHVLGLMAQDEAPFIHFWPKGHQWALVLTHDIETAGGLAHVRAVADLEERLGFRSSFNFVTERYSLDRSLMQELRDRGFEIGVHGLKHDGKLFSSHAEFARRAKLINHYLEELEAVGFRAPLTHRHPGWMQELEIEYDLSFFDTDPYEPIPGGTMSIWPFEIGHFIELPYTLAQDYTLTAILGERTPRIWLRKLEFIERYHGMALLNTHPDYLKEAVTWSMYADFLHAVKERGGYWHALPRDAAAWWRARAVAPSLDALPGAVQATARPADGGLVIGLPK